MNAAGVKGLVLTINFRCDHVSMRDGCRVRSTGDDVIIVANFVSIRVGAVPFSVLDGVLNSLSFRKCTRRTHVHILISINILEGGLVSALPCIAPGSI